MALQGRVVHLGHFRMAGQEADHLQRILHMALHAQAQCLNALQQDEGVEGRNGGTGVAQQDGTDAGDEGCCSHGVGKHDAVIRGVGLGQCGEFLGIGLPVELAAVDDYAAQTAAMTAQELGGRVHYDVGSVLKRPD